MKNENILYNMVCLARYTLITLTEDSDNFLENDKTVKRNFGGLKHFTAVLLYLQFMYQTYFNCFNVV